MKWYSTPLHGGFMNKAKPITKRRVKTILAALRSWQHDIDSGVIDPKDSPIAADNNCRPLNSAEIDRLCEDINCGSLLLQE